MFREIRTACLVLACVQSAHAVGSHTKLRAEAAVEKCEVDCEAEAGDDDKEENRAAFEGDQLIMASLLSMGFSENGCKRACKAVNNSNAEAAMEWVFAHVEDPDLNDPLPAEGSGVANGSGSGLAGGAGEEAFDEMAIAALSSLGFPGKHINKSLRACKGDAERAADWLCSRSPEELDAEEETAGGDGAAEGEKKEEEEKEEEKKEPPAAADSDDEEPPAAVEEQEPPATVEEDPLAVKLRMLDGTEFDARLANGGGGATVRDLETDVAVAEFLLAHAPHGWSFFFGGEEAVLGDEALLADFTKRGECALFLVPLSEAATVEIRGSSRNHRDRWAVKTAEIGGWAPPGFPGGLSRDRIRGLGRAQIGWLSREQIGRLSSDQIRGHATRSGGTVSCPLSREQIGWLSQDQIGWFSRGQIRGLSRDQIGGLSEDAIDGLSPDQIDELSQDQIEGLSQEQIGRLSRAARGAMVWKLTRTL